MEEQLVRTLIHTAIVELSSWDKHYAKTIGSDDVIEQVIHILVSRWNIITNEASLTSQDKDIIADIVIESYNIVILEDKIKSKKKKKRSLCQILS